MSRLYRILMLASLFLLAMGTAAGRAHADSPGMSLITLSDDGKHFIKKNTGERFNP